tara:strand:- start:285 stop:419 length:135 start_codon:yes stop_codon:yes gene_type:complete
MIFLKKSIIKMAIIGETSKGAPLNGKISLIGSRIKSVKLYKVLI